MLWYTGEIRVLNPGKVVVLYRLARGGRDPAGAESLPPRASLRVKCIFVSYCDIGQD